VIMKIRHLILALAAATQAHSALIGIGDTWGSANGTAASASLVSSTPGTTAAVSYTYTNPTSTSSTGSPAGVTQSLAIGTLGLNATDYIKLSFSVTATGATTDPSWNRAFSFGFADLDSNGIIAQSTLGTTATSTTSVINLNFRSSVPTTGNAGTIFRGKATGTQVTTTQATFPAYVSSLSTFWTLTLTRQTDGGALVSLTAVDSNNNVSIANTQSLTASDVNSLNFDTLLFGVRDGYNTSATGTLTFSVSNIQLENSAVPEPGVLSLALIGAGAGGFMIWRRRKTLA